MSDREFWDVTIAVRIEDKERLVQAARAHPDAEGMATEDFYLGDGEVDVGACLTMLLDPGTIPGAGFSIDESSATAVDNVFTVDFGDERN